MRPFAVLAVVTAALALQGCLSVPVKVRSVPPGAVVYANGQPIGTTPIEVHPDDLFPAQREGIQWVRRGTLSLQRPGCETETYQVDNELLERSLRVELECEPGAERIPVPIGNVGPVARPAADTARTRERLEELEAMRRDGLISEAEYQMLRERVLERF